MILRTLSIQVAALMIATGFLASCGNSTEEATEANLDTMIDSSDVSFGVGGKVFIIPSPLQTAMLIQKSGAQYNKGMLNSPEAVNGYSTKFLKCVNLGIYGADLGYTTLYDQTEDALSYFKTINTLATDLNLSNAFSPELINRFQSNIGNKDSMLNLVSVAFRTSNDFLKNNDRKEEAALVIAGGWIETLQFAINIYKAKGGEDVKRRIAEQKGTLENLIALISTFEGNEEYAQLLKNLEELQAEYAKVSYKYVYDRPQTDEENKLTTLTSKSEITITAENIEAIAAKVAAIRAMVVA